MKTKTIVHKSAAPIYAAAVTWVLYALLFPLYQVGHFLLAAAASAVVALIARMFCRDVTETVEVPEEPVSTGNVDLDKAIAEGDAAIKAMRALNDRIQDETISGQIDRLEEVSGRIFALAQKDPDKKAQLQKFMNYYLPTALKLLHTYASLSRQAVEGTNITEAKHSIERSMDLLVTAFENQLDKLFQSDALDISADVAALEGMLNLDGLAASDFKPGNASKGFIEKQQ